jgi:hypothetical protein
MPSKARKVLCALLLLVLATCAEASVSITSIKASEDQVKFQGTFDVTARLSGDTCNSLRADYYIDRPGMAPYRFDYNNVACGSDTIVGKFKLDANGWEDQSITCGPHTIWVELHVLTGDSMVANRSTTLDVGKMAEITFSPAQPLPEREARITLTDPETGNPIGNTDVTMKDIYGGDSIGKRTDPGGSFTFIPKVAGEYRMSIRGKDVCGEGRFFAKKTMLVDGPRPDNPVVNEMVIIAVPAGAGVGIKILDSAGQPYLSPPVAYNGGANFSISRAGTYTILIGDQSTKYWGTNKTLVVSDRLMPEIKIAPEQPVIGKTATITVSSRGQPLSGAVVTVKKPDGVDRDFTATDYGTINYDTITTTGTYAVRASKDRYAAGTATFEAKHSLEARIEPTAPTVRDTITLVVGDENGKAVSDVLVEIPAIAFKRVTDMGGKVSFNLQEAKEYEIRLSKDLYWDRTMKLTPYGILSIGECVTEFELGGNIALSVLDSFNNPTAADINVKDPDGIVRYYNGPAQTVTPEKPGQYGVAVSKTNYIDSNLTFNVLPHPLEIRTWMSTGQLTVNVTSKAVPVAQLKVSVEMAGVSYNGTTSPLGQASFNINHQGNVTVSVNAGRDNRNYAEKTVQQSIVRSYNLIFLATPLIIIFAITVLAIAAIGLGRMYLGGGGWKLPSIGLGKARAKTKHDSVLLGDKKPSSSRLSKL